MELRDYIYVGLAVLTAITFVTNVAKDTSKEKALITKLEIVLDNLKEEIIILNKNVAALGEKTNGFNREVGILDNKVNGLFKKVEALEKEVVALRERSYKE